MPFKLLPQASRSPGWKAAAPRARATFGRSVLGLALAASGATVSYGATPLADSPVFAVQQAPGNVALVLSVEYPTVVSVAYTDRTYRSSGADYLGYFDPNKCYDYQSSASDSTLAPATTAASYFVPAGSATAHICSGKWSGHFLNWASMQTIDPFRWVLTGGYRVLDTPSTTVLEKAWATGQGGVANFPDGAIPASDIAGATPFKAMVANGATSMAFRVQGLGNRLRFLVPSFHYDVSYFNSIDLSGPAVLTRPEPNTSAIVGFQSPGPGVSAARYSARYSTTIKAPLDGFYKFKTSSDDGARFYLNGVRLIDNWPPGGQGTTDAFSNAVKLNAGDTMTIVTEYRQLGGGASLSVSWQLPGYAPNQYTEISSYQTGSLYSNTNVDYTGGTQIVADTSYDLFVRAQVCNNSANAGGLEANCVAYAQGFKPQGLIQSYSNKLRFSAFSYLDDPNLLRDGGVLRARQKFVGPTQPVPGSPPIANVPLPVNSPGFPRGTTTAGEWDSVTGMYVSDPDTLDSGGTNTNFGTSVKHSGVMNYLNQFGQLSHLDDKVYDPVSELYYAAVRYFKHLGNVPEWSSMSGVSAAQKNVYADGFPVITDWDDPILYSCQRNTIVGIGDVNTHADKNLPGNTNSTEEPTLPFLVSSDPTNAVLATNQIGLLEGFGASYGSAPFGGDSNSALIAGLAYDSHVNDMRPDIPGSNLTVPKPRIEFSTIDTYWVDVQEGQRYLDNNQFYLATKYGGFTVPSDYKYGEPFSTTTWHNNTFTNGSNLQPDNYFSGGSPDLMKSGLTAAFADISSKQKPVTTAFSTALSQIATSGNATYSSKYQAADWTGEVAAGELTFNAANDPVATTRWTLASLLNTQLTANNGWDFNRRVVTWNPVSSAGVPLRSGNIATTQLAALDTSYVSGDDSSNFLNYLRGDQLNDKASKVDGSTKAYRKRTQLLGDIVDSKIRVVGPPTFPYLDATNPGYADFKKTFASRPTVIYFGGNDGMLHAVDGDLASATTVPSGPGGTELFAYVPAALFGGPNNTPNTDGLASLGNPSFSHHFMVDATPAQYDVDFSRIQGATSTASGDWRSLLIGGLGKGGKSYYAIDVTESAKFVSAAAAATSSAAATVNEQVVAGKVLWEFSASSDVALGYSFGDPIVAKTKKYGWVVVLPSGYNNSDGIGRLFLINPKTGALIETLSTGVGSTANDAGLAQVNSFINDSTDGTVDSLYAGDLLGNLWRFDMTALAGSSGNYPAPKLIATLKDSTGAAQPVTTAPSLAVDPLTLKRFVLVGTGRLLDSTDIASTQQQTFYAIVDGTNARFNAASDLPAQVTFPITRADLYNNVSSLDDVTFEKTTQVGWYEDIGAVGGTGAGTGWRVIKDSTTLSGAVIFSTTRPDLSDICSPGGTSRVYGRAFGDTSTVLLTPVVKGTNSIETSYYSYADVVSDHQFFSVAGKTKVLVGSSRGLDDPNLKPLQPPVPRRLNWRELRVVD